jgi:predicted phage gp36 major capsid-like protein
MTTPIPNLDQLRTLDARQLDAAMAAIDLELVDLHEGDDGEIRSDLSPAESKRFNELLDLRNRVEGHAKIRQQFDRSGGQAALAGDRDQNGDHRTIGEFGEARRTIDTAARSGLLPDHAAEKATQLVEQGSTRDRSLAARWAVAAGDPNYLTCFAKLLTAPTRGHLLWNEREQAAYRHAAEVQSELRAMSLTDASGGFMVPLTVDPAIMLTSSGSIKSAAAYLPRRPNRHRSMGGRHLGGCNR